MLIKRAPLSAQRLKLRALILRVVRWYDGDSDERSQSGELEGIRW